MEDLSKKQSFSPIVEKGMAIYEKRKGEYEPKYHGKSLAIEVDSEEIFMGNSGVEAVEKAKAKHPDKMFYMMVVGIDGMAMLRRSMIGYI